MRTPVVIGCALPVPSLSVAIFSAFHLVGSTFDRSKRHTLPFMSPPYACSTYGFWRLPVKARIVLRSVGSVSVPVSFGNGIFFSSCPDFDAEFGFSTYRQPLPP